MGRPDGVFSVSLPGGLRRRSIEASADSGRSLLG
jgi:hypothetical protein